MSISCTMLASWPNQKSCMANLLLFAKETLFRMTFASQLTVSQAILLTITKCTAVSFTITNNACYSNANYTFMSYHIYIYIYNTNQILVIFLIKFLIKGDVSYSYIHI